MTLLKEIIKCRKDRKDKPSGKASSFDSEEEYFSFDSEEEYFSFDSEEEDFSFDSEEENFSFDSDEEEEEEEETVSLLVSALTIGSLSFVARLVSLKALTTSARARIRKTSARIFVACYSFSVFTAELCTVR